MPPLSGACRRMPERTPPVDWAQLLRTFDFDVLVYVRCGGRLSSGGTGLSTPERDKSGCHEALKDPER